MEKDTKVFTPSFKDTVRFAVFGITVKPGVFKNQMTALNTPVLPSTQVTQSGTCRSAASSVGALMKVISGFWWRCWKLALWNTLETLIFLPGRNAQLRGGGFSSRSSGVWCSLPSMHPTTLISPPKRRDRHSNGGECVLFAVNQSIVEEVFRVDNSVCFSHRNRKGRGHHPPTKGECNSCVQSLWVAFPCIP